MPCLDELRHRADGLLDRDRLVDAVLVVEVDVVDAEPLQRGVARLAHVLRLAVDAEEAAVLAALVAELRGEHDLVAAAGDRAAHELLVGERAVHVGGVEEDDPELERPVDGGDGLVLVGGAVELGHPHAAEALGRYLEALAAECALLHGRSFLVADSTIGLTAIGTGEETAACPPGGSGISVGGMRRLLVLLLAAGLLGAGATRRRRQAAQEEPAAARVRLVHEPARLRPAQRAAGDPRHAARARAAAGPRERRRDGRRRRGPLGRARAAWPRRRPPRAARAPRRPTCRRPASTSPTG